MNDPEVSEVDFADALETNFSWIKVIGIGKSGIRAVNHMMASGLSGVEFLAMDTDEETLAEAQARNVIPLGPICAGGRGTNGDSALGRLAAEESCLAIKKALGEAYMVIMVAGMGGGTAMGAAPVIARLVKGLGAMAIGVVSSPFLFEGKARGQQAENGIQELSLVADTLVIIPNARLVPVNHSDGCPANMFRMADEALHQAVRCLSDLYEGPVGLDIADVMFVMNNAGTVRMGIGAAQGDMCDVEAALKALSCPLLEDMQVAEINGLLVKIATPTGTLEDDICEVLSVIDEQTLNGAHTFFQVLKDDLLHDAIRITLLASWPCTPQQPSAFAASGRPEKEIYSEKCLEKIRENPVHLAHIPETQRTPILCSLAVQMNSAMLEFVPEELKTQALCCAAVRACGYALEYVPEKFRTEELCRIAVQSDGWALMHVPEALKMPELCFSAVQQLSAAMDYVPEDMKTPELWLTAIRRAARAFHRMPNELKTAEICLAAVQLHGGTLEFMPDKVKTPELCLAAVIQAGFALRYVPEALKTSEICRQAVKHWARALEFVPERLKTPELCLIAVQATPSSFCFVPEKIIAEICHAAVHKNAGALQSVPDAYKTPEICLAAVTKKGLALKYVLEELKTSALCRVAVQQCAWALEYVPEILKTEELCLLAVNSEGSTLKYVPEPLQTLEVCCIAAQGEYTW